MKRKLTALLAWLAAGAAVLAVAAIVAAAMLTGPGTAMAKGVPNPDASATALAGPPGGTTSFTFYDTRTHSWVTQTVPTASLGTVYETSGLGHGGKCILSFLPGWGGYLASANDGENLWQLFRGGLVGLVAPRLDCSAFLSGLTRHRH